MIATLIIRADDSAAIGSGHAMRCLALAQEWRSRGGRVAFVAAETTPAFRERLAAADIGSQVIAAAPGTVEDAADTVALAQTQGTSWIVADGYRLGLDWQRAVKASGLRLLVLDDHDFCETFCADLILNQNALPAGRDYRDRAPGAGQLLGTRYTLLRREFSAWSGWKREIPAEARKILVTLGGADPDNVTAKIVAALGRLADIEAVVVVGGANPHRVALEALAAVQPVSVRIEINSPRMAELMAWADLAVTAGGSTSWELAFMGLPAVQCVLAGNQAGIAAELHRLGVTINLGGHADLAVETIAGAVRALAGDAERRRTMSERGRRLVDGHGAARVAAALGAPLRITLVSDAGSWYDDYIDDLRDTLAARGHAVACIHAPADIPAGDLVFLLSLGRLVSPEVLRRNPHNLVVHGSALPAGRGWSPITWQILAGQNEIPMTLLEAGEGADTGDIYLSDTMHFRGDELVDELRAAQADSTARLCLRFVERYPFIAGEGRVQTGEGSWYPRRRADDSRLDPDKTLREQFNRLRVADADRYPAFFELAGHRYEIRLTKKPVPPPKPSSSP